MSGFSDLCVSFKKLLMHFTWRLGDTLDLCVSPETKKTNRELGHFSICALPQVMLQTAAAKKGLYKPLYIAKRET